MSSLAGSPLSVYLREDAVIARETAGSPVSFASHRLAGTIRNLVAAQQSEAAPRADEMRGPTPATVARWITEGEAEKAGYELGKRKPARPVTGRRMTEAEIKSVVDKLADIAGVLSTSQRTRTA